ncbi:hypothetical protein ES703_19661 [subsurface metagenome]
MVKFSCKSHGVTLIIEGNKRTFQNPPGSYAGMPHCQLHLMAKPTEGKFQDCEIVKEGES